MARGDDPGPHPVNARIAIVGLGLIGGSLARDLAALGAHVLGFDTDAGALAAAMELGAVHEVLPLDSGALASANLDALVLAVPLQSAVPLLSVAAPHLARVPLVTDVGSTKATITATASGLGLGERFVGSHPMAGSHLSGWGASRPGLFRGARVYLCPSPEAGQMAGEEAGREALSRAYSLWTAVGALPETMDAAAHDHLLAWTSHLPQAASTALARALGGAGIIPGALGPGGRDMTRLASSSPDLWTGVVLDNATALAEGLAALEREVARLQAALHAGDREVVHEFFAEGASWLAAAVPQLRERT